MARHGNLYRDTVVVNDYGRAVILAGASVRFYLPDDGAPYPGLLYAGRDDADPVVMPYVTGSTGEIEVWGDEPVRLRMVVTAPGKSTAIDLIDIEPDPASQASDAEVAGAVAAHEAATDPHPAYLTQPEGNARYQGAAEKGQANGYAPLDAGRLLPAQYLPPLAITDTYTAASQAEMLALPAQTGDVCVRSDTGRSYLLADDPASVLTNWVELGGTTGPPGEDGAPGPPGPPGATGATGAPGAVAVYEQPTAPAVTDVGTLWIDTDEAAVYGPKWQALTQAAYDALPAKDPNTLYLIV